MRRENNDKRTSATKIMNKSLVDIDKIFSRENSISGVRLGV